MLVYIFNLPCKHKAYQKIIRRIR